MDSAIARGSLTSAEKKRLLDIVDLEMERVDLEADTMDQLAAALQTLTDTIDETIAKASQVS